MKVMIRTDDDNDIHFTENIDSSYIYILRDDRNDRWYKAHRENRGGLVHFACLSNSHLVYGYLLLNLKELIEDCINKGHKVYCFRALSQMFDFIQRYEEKTII